MTDRPRRLLITDLDNTLWDWFEAWYESFSALLDGLATQIDAAIRAEQQTLGVTPSQVRCGHVDPRAQVLM